jgi:hypothetical protein
MAPGKTFFRRVTDLKYELRTKGNEKPQNNRSRAAYHSIFH